MTDDIDPTGGTVRDAVQQKGYGHEVDVSADDSVGTTTINRYREVCGATGEPRQGGQRTWDTLHNEAFHHVKGTHKGFAPGQLSRHLVVLSRSAGTSRRKPGP